MANFTPSPELWNTISGIYSNPSNRQSYLANNGSPEYFDQASGMNFAPSYDRTENFTGGTFYKIGGKGNYDAPGSVFDANGNFTQDFNVHHDAPSFMDNYGWMVPLLAAGGAAATGLGGAGAGAATTGATTAPVLGATGALTGTPLASAAAGGGLAGAGAAAAGGGGLASLFGGAGSKIAGGLASLVSGQGGGGSGNGGGIMDLLNRFGPAIATGLSDNRFGQAGADMRSFLDKQLQTVNNTYAPGSPEFQSLFDQMSRKDAAAGRNSQYGPRSVDLAGKITQIKTDNLARMVPGISRAYAEALNQDAARYSGLAAQLGLANTSGGFGNIGNTVKNLSSLFGNTTGNGPDGFPDGFGNLGFPDPLTQTTPEGDFFDISDWFV